MRIIKHSFNDEFWGATVPVYEYEVTESYGGEVREIVESLIEEGFDKIPTELEVSDDNDENTTIIDPFDFLSKQDVKELNDKIDEEFNDDYSHYNK